MTIYRGIGGVNRELKEQYRSVAGVNRQIKEQYRGADGVNRQVFGGKKYLYNGGDEFVSLTGGWSITYKLGSGNATKEAASLLLSIPYGASNAVGLKTANLIDITNYSVISINITEFSQTGAGNVSIRISRNANGVDGAVAQFNIGSIGMYNFDISNLSGTYYITFYAQSGAGGSDVARCNQIFLST